MTPLPDRDPLPTCVKGLDPLPDSYVATLSAGLRAAVGGVDMPAGGVAPGSGERFASPTEAQLEAIGDHARLLMAWNPSINLSGIRGPEEIAREHVLDSLTALSLMRLAAIDDFVDLGSGGGYPGIPLAVALPGCRALLVESIAKKARFLSVAVAVAGIENRVSVAAARAETVAGDPSHRGRWSCVVARAVADLSELAELSLPLLRIGGLLVAWKRLPVDDELDRAEPALRILGGRIEGIEPVTVPGLEDHVLAVVEKVAATPPQYPRDPAARRRSPP